MNSIALALAAELQQDCRIVLESSRHGALDADQVAAASAMFWVNRPRRGQLAIDNVAPGSTARGTNGSATSASIRPLEERPSPDSSLTPIS